MAGDELFRLADHSRVWVIAEVAEADIAAIEVGTPATVTLRAFPNEPREGAVEFHLSGDHEAGDAHRVGSHRVAQSRWQDEAGDVCRCGLPSGRRRRRVTAAPASAIIDSGTRQVVLIAKGEGRFEPREVKLGRRGDGYTEIKEGLSVGEEVVTSANFLIDAESNLKAALQAFAKPEPPP